jgi:hypothetical protein
MHSDFHSEIINEEAVKVDIKKQDWLMQTGLLWHRVGNTWKEISCVCD